MPLLSRATAAVRRMQRFLGAEHEYRTASIATLTFGILYAWLEYYYIFERRPGLPFSRAYEPIFMGFYFYHLFPMLPIFGLVAFGPFLDDMLFKLRPTPEYVEKGRTLLLGIANTWMAVWVEDIFWFVFRTVNPLKESCLGWKWIQWMARCQPVESTVYPDKIIVPVPDWILVKGPEWTARWGFISFGQNALPYWYIITVVLLAVAYYVVFYFRKS